MLFKLPFSLSSELILLFNDLDSKFDLFISLILSPNDLFPISVLLSILFKLPISLSSELKSSLKELESVFNLNVSLVLLSILLIFSLFNIESTFCKLLAFSILSLSILLNSLLDISLLSLTDCILLSSFDVFKLTVSSFDKLFVLNILDDKSSSLEPI